MRLPPENLNRELTHDKKEFRRLRRILKSDEALEEFCAYNDRPEYYQLEAPQIKRAIVRADIYDEIEYEQELDRYAYPAMWSYYGGSYRVWFNLEFKIPPRDGKSGCIFCVDESLARKRPVLMRGSLAYMVAKYTLHTKHSDTGLALKICERYLRIKKVTLVTHKQIRKMQKALSAKMRKRFDLPPHGKAFNDHLDRMLWGKNNKYEIRQFDTLCEIWVRGEQIEHPWCVEQREKYNDWVDKIAALVRIEIPLEDEWRRKTFFKDEDDPFPTVLKDWVPLKKNRYGNSNYIYPDWDAVEKMDCHLNRSHRMEPSYGSPPAWNPKENRDHVLTVTLFGKEYRMCRWGDGSTISPQEVFESYKSEMKRRGSIAEKAKKKIGKGKISPFVAQQALRELGIRTSQAKAKETLTSILEEEINV